MLITNFSSGELSKNIYGRIDLQQYYQGVSFCKNFNVNSFGGIKRRSGFKRLEKMNGNSRIIPFIINKSVNYIFEFIEGKIFVWENGNKLVDANNNQLYFETDYEQYEIPEIQYAQNYNKIVFAHENHRPYMVEYDFTNRNFFFGDMQFDFIPNVNLDDDYNLIYIAINDFPLVVKKENGLYSVNNKYYRKDEIYCLLKNKLYKYDTDEQKWNNYDTEEQENQELFTTENMYPKCVTFFNSRLWFANTKKSRQGIWASATPDIDGNRYNDFSTYQKYVTVNKVLKDADIHIFSCDILLENINNDYSLLTNVTQDFTQSGILLKEITEYFVNNELIPIGAKVIEVTTDTIKIDKKPNITENRIGIVTTIQLWKDSKNPSSEDYEYIVISNSMTTADCSLYFELASAENDAIQWIVSNNFLGIGTESNIWALSNNVNAVQIQVQMIGKYGSDNIQALCIDSALVFFAQGKYGIREYYYNNQSEAFTTNNIAILAEQMLEESPAIDFDYMNNPCNMLYIVRADGTIVALLYDKNNSIMAWHRIEHAEGKIVNLCITHGDRQNDYVYVVVQYDDDYYLELLDTNNQIYIDSYEKFTNANQLMNYNNNAILFNETTKTSCSVNNIPNNFIGNNHKVYIGYKYESKIKSLPILSEQDKKRIVNLQIRFIDSYFPYVKIDNTQEEKFKNIKEPYSGVKHITVPGITEKDVFFEIRYNEPFAINILSVNTITT